MRKKRQKYLKIIKVFLPILILVIVGIFFIFQKTDVDHVNKNGPYLEETKEPINDNDQKIQKVEPWPSNFASLPQHLLEEVDDIETTPAEGFFITTSVLSNKKDKVVYAEISDWIKSPTKPKNSLLWKFNIYIKDLNTNKIQKIYSSSQKKQAALKRFFIRDVYAGGCRRALFPIAWSKNDTQIILEEASPGWCGSGGGPKYKTYAIDINNKKISDLATRYSIFFDNYSKVFYIDVSDNSPKICGPAWQGNYGAVVFKNIESGFKKTIFEEPNTNYSLKNIDDEKKLKYTATKVFSKENGCVDENREGQTEIRFIETDKLNLQ